MLIHLAIGLLAVSLTCLALSFVSLLYPDAPVVGGSFVLGSFVAVALSLLLFLYVRRSQL